jgi:hypothetical protein
LEVEQKTESFERQIGLLGSELVALRRTVDSLTNDVEKVHIAKRATIEEALEKLSKLRKAKDSVYMEEYYKRAEDTTNQASAASRTADAIPDWVKVQYGIAQMKKDKSLEGILSQMTEKQSGNVQVTVKVTITSKSVSDDPMYALQNVADLSSDSEFWSKNEPGQWVCWDFGTLTVHPTHYTLKTGSLKSWILEGSADGNRWTMIDQQTDNQELKDAKIASFAISKPADFRFIRLTQVGKNRTGGAILRLTAVEFFGFFGAP